MTTLTISIAVHNNKDLTRRCIESIVAQTDLSYKLVVTDNASTDGTRELLEGYAARGALELRRKQKNTGFSVPHNEAFAQCESEYFAVLNNDLEVCSHWASRMVEELDRDPKIAEVGIKRSCVSMDADGNGFPGDDLEYIEASCAMVRTATIRSLPGGLFDPSLKFAYYEDSDLSLRIRKADFRISVVDLAIIHQGSATARIVKGVDLEGYKIRNKQVFLNRWGSYLKSRIDKRVSKDRIVVRRGGARGDVILTTPIVRALRKLHPKSTIIVSTACTDVYQGNPDINEISLQGVPLRPSDLTYDLDMAYERRPQVHAIQAYADVVGIQVDDWRPRVYANDSSRIVAEQRLPDIVRNKYALIHAGFVSGWVGRQWPHVRFQPVIDDLKKRGYKTVNVGAYDSPQMATDLDFRNVAFQHLVALMERAALFVGLDSMPFHVAQACATPSVAIFGCVDPDLRIIPGLPVQPVVTEKVGCLGCHHWRPGPARTVTNECIRGKDYCMDWLTPDEVMAGIDALEERLKQKAPVPVQ